MKDGFSILVKCLYPFAPHLASEIWWKSHHQDIRTASSLGDDLQTFKSILKPKTDTTLPFKLSINGKFAGILPLDQGVSQETLLSEVASADTSQVRNKKLFSQFVAGR